jgi:hypothetical protein
MDDPFSRVLDALTGDEESFVRVLELLPNPLTLPLTDLFFLHQPVLDRVLALAFQVGASNLCALRIVARLASVRLTFCMALQEVPGVHAMAGITESATWSGEHAQLLRSVFARIAQLLSDASSPELSPNWVCVARVACAWPLCRGVYGLLSLLCGREAGRVALQTALSWNVVGDLLEHVGSVMRAEDAGTLWATRWKDFLQWFVRSMALRPIPLCALTLQHPASLLRVVHGLVALSERTKDRVYVDAVEVTLLATLDMVLVSVPDVDIVALGSEVAATLFGRCPCVVPRVVGMLPWVAMGCSRLLMTGSALARDVFHELHGATVRRHDASTEVLFALATCEHFLEWINHEMDTLETSGKDHGRHEEVMDLLRALGTVHLEGVVPILLAVFERAPMSFVSVSCLAMMLNACESVAMTLSPTVVGRLWHVGGSWNGRDKEGPDHAGYSYAKSRIARDILQCMQSAEQVDEGIVRHGVAEKITRLPRVPDGELHQTCNVCWKTLNCAGTTPACLLPSCGHMFHCGCAFKWLWMHDTCPVCRGPVLAAMPFAFNPPVSFFQEVFSACDVVLLQ